MLEMEIKYATGKLWLSFLCLISTLFVNVERLNNKIKYCINFLFSHTIELEQELGAERQEYEELTARYELLEEEHVVTKAQLTMDRDKAESAVEMSQQELGTLEGELQTLRETYNNKQDAWIKEKLDIQVSTEKDLIFSDCLSYF
jgi:SMC interacting uncharacterized protein involved in chromosome segregation